MLPLEVFDLIAALSIETISQLLQLLLMSLLKFLDFALVIRLELLGGRCMVILQLLDSFFEFLYDLALTSHESIFLPCELLFQLKYLSLEVCDLFL